MNYRFNSSNTPLANAEGWISIGVNTLLFILKYWAGIVTGSLALIADAWHTLSDSISSVVLLVGIKYSRKPADQHHPFGHGRSELVASLLIGAMLTFVAFYFASEGIGKLRNREGTTYGTLAIVVTIISILLKEGLAQVAFYISRRTGSISVNADGWHHRSDALSSVVVLVGIFIGKYFWWIDGTLSIIVALLILYSGIKVITDSAEVILGEVPTDDLVEKVKEIIFRQGFGKMEAHHFHIHNYIMHQELTFHVRLPNLMTIEQAHKIISNIEDVIRTELGIDATIHVEPEKTDKRCKHID
ncbi:MAG TPA: cation transporter [Bacteroidales bacterium]|nr:cation transporter [Bacteroidales bacterium]